MSFKVYKPGVRDMFVDCRNLDGNMRNGVGGVQVVCHGDKGWKTWAA